MLILDTQKGYNTMQKILLYTELVILITVTIFVAIHKPTQEVATQPVIEQEVITKSSDFNDPISVEYAFVDKGGCGRIQVRNNSTNQLISYILQVYYFDEGKELIENKTVEIKNVRIAPNFTGGMDKHIPMPVSSCKYLWARVESAEFTTAEPWINENINEAVEMKPIGLEEIKINKPSIENSCSFLEITNISPAKEDVNSERKNLIFYVKNIGDKPVKNINFIIAQYDEEGNPVNVAPNIYVGENIRQLYWNDVALAPNKGKKAVSQLVLEPECTQVKLIVESVEFENSIVWLNQDSLAWILNN